MFIIITLVIILVTFILLAMVMSNRHIRFDEYGNDLELEQDIKDFIIYKQELEKRKNLI